jgi:transcriptional regulator with XRE-family HTH domain
VIIGERLRALREYKALSQVDMEKRTGLFRYYISRVENGHTIPTLETLTRFARALEVPVFHLVYEEDGPYQPPVLPGSTSSLESSVSLSKRDLHLLEQLNILFSRLRDRDRELLFALARKMANQTPSPIRRRRTTMQEARPASRTPLDQRAASRNPNCASANSRKRKSRPRARQR